MAIHSLQASFNAGVLTPLLDARVGVEKYANGCRILRNAVVSVHGPVTKRPGLEHLGMADTAAIPPRLLGLNFSATTSFVVEITRGKFRFWSDGQLVAWTLAHPYSDSDIQDLQAAQVNDVIYLTHPSYNPRILERYGNLDWRLREIHQPATGWTAPSPTTPATGNAVQERWVVTPGSLTTVALAAAYADANAASENIPASGTPYGSGNQYFASIARLRGWFVPPTTGTYKFQANGLGANNQGRVMFNSTAYGPASGATAIITAGSGTTDSANFSLVAGSAYYFEALLNNIARPAGGGFKFFLGGVDQGYIEANFLGATLGVYTGTTLDGWPALLDENITATTITPSGTTGNITLTASAAVWTKGHIGSWWQIAHRRDTAFAEIAIAAVGAYAATSTAITGSGLRVVGKYTVYTYGTWTGDLFLEELQPDGVTWATIRTWRSKADRNVIDTGTAEGEAHLRLRVTAGTAGASLPRFLLECADSKVYGLVRITGYTSATSVSATVYSPLEATTATPFWTEGAWNAVQGYPRTVCLHQQRTTWGGTLKRPQSIWGSVTGDFENFRRSTFDDGSYLYQIATENSFVIQWMLSQGDLLIGTSLDEWIAATPQDAPVTPVNLAFRRQAAVGSEYKQAVLIRETVVFTQRNALALSRMIYRENGRYGASDITILASHLFRGKIRQMAWQAQPSSVLWIVLENGNLVGLTYEEDQNVFACHEHTTDGQFKSVTVIHGPFGDEVYFSVLRSVTTLPAGLPVTAPNYTIERFEPKTLASGAQGPTGDRRCFLDSATIKTSPSTFASLLMPHMQGRTVYGLADNVPVGPFIVGDMGLVTLPTPVYTCCLGLPYVMEVQPMRLEAQMQDGTAQGRKFKINRAVLRLLDSYGGVVQSREDSEPTVIDYSVALEYMPPPDAPDVGIAAWPSYQLFTGDKQVVLDSRHGESVDVVVSQVDPMPFTLVGLVVMVDIYGD